MHAQILPIEWPRGYLASATSLPSYCTLTEKAAKVLTVKGLAVTIATQAVIFASLYNVCCPIYFFSSSDRDLLDFFSFSIPFVKHI